ncbi:hypothetical protein L286_23180 [Sphingobium sp. HDIP04]|nr:hypothetical protein L286_23180 [Sphingobium sp. HDIP04]
MKWVYDFGRSPCSLERRQFSSEPRCACRITVETARNRFMMNKRCTRFVEGLPASLVEPHTKIHIIESDREIIFVETTDGKEAVARYDQTGGRHG